jgi:hypothetical protein
LGISLFLSFGAEKPGHLWPGFSAPKDQTTKFIIAKNPALEPDQVDLDVKVLMFNEKN